MWAGLWTERAQFPDTALAIVYESQGLFEQAQETYEQVSARTGARCCCR